MFFLAVASIVASTPTNAPRASAGALVQATATIRVISGARLSFHAPNERGIPHARNSMINTPEGRQPARLIEFQ
jgi:hypothetical protein